MWDLLPISDGQTESSAVVTELVEATERSGGEETLNMPHKYELLVFWSSDDDAFIVEVPDLPGCMAHGATPADAVAEAEQAIDLWIETARDLGRPVPEPRERAVNQIRRG